MENIEPAYIEELKWSIISCNVKFHNLIDILPTRKENLKITDMLWITKQPIIDSNYFVYNPKAVILVFLN